MNLGFSHNFPYGLYLRVHMTSLEPCREYARFISRHRMLCLVSILFKMEHDCLADLAEKFGWGNILFPCMELFLGRSAINRSILCNGGGTNSDFTGGADGWGTACKFITASGRRYGYNVELSMKTTCEP